ASPTSASCCCAKVRGTRRDFPRHRRPPIDKADRPRDRTVAIDRKPGDQTELGLPGLSREAGRPACLGTGAAPQALSPGASQGATMACGTKTRAAMVAGTDLRLAEAAVPDRPGHADISRSDLSQPIRSDARRTEERTDGTSADQTTYA